MNRSFAKETRRLLAEALSSAAELQAFTHKPQVRQMRRFSASDVDGLNAEVLYILVVPGPRLVRRSEKDCFDRFSSPEVLVVRRLGAGRKESHQDEAEFLLEEVERWLLQIENSQLDDTTIFTSLVDTNTSREPYDRLFMEEDVFVSSVFPEYTRNE